MKNAALPKSIPFDGTSDTITVQPDHEIYPITLFTASQSVRLKALLEEGHSIEENQSVFGTSAFGLVWSRALTEEESRLLRDYFEIVLHLKSRYNPF